MAAHLYIPRILLQLIITTQIFINIHRNIISFVQLSQYSLN